MTKPTEGPWRYNNKSGYIYGPDCVVAVVGAFSDKELVPFNKDRWNADGRLLAASWEMRERLELDAIALDAAAMILEIAVLPDGDTFQDQATHLLAHIEQIRALLARIDRDTE